MINYTYILVTQKSRRFDVIRELIVDIKIRDEKNRSQYARVIEDIMKFYHVMLQLTIKVIDFSKFLEVVYLTREIAIANEVLL